MSDDGERPATPRTRARELRLQRLLGEDERGRRIQQHSEERMFVTSLNREVRTIRAQRMRGEQTRTKQADARARREQRKLAALDTLNDVERKLHLATTCRNGKIEGTVPHTTANGAIKPPPAARDEDGEASPPQPLLPLHDVSAHKRVFQPSRHLIATPRTNAASFLPPVSPRKSDEAGAEGDTSPDATRQEAQKRRLMNEAAQRVLALHKSRENRQQRAERSEAQATSQDEAAKQRFGRTQ